MTKEQIKQIVKLTETIVNKKLNEGNSPDGDQLRHSHRLAQTAIEDMAITLGKMRKSNPGNTKIRELHQEMSKLDYRFHDTLEDEIKMISHL